jgi:hypothetical protein
MRFGEPRVDEARQGELEKLRRQRHVAEHLTAADDMTELHGLAIEPFQPLVNRQRALVEVDGPAEVALLAIAEPEMAELRGLAVQSSQPLVDRKGTVVITDRL